MVIKWKNFKEIFIRRKGLGILGSSDILGTAITSIFWFYMASVIQPEKYGEIFYLISIVAIAFNLSNIGTQNNMVVLTAKGKNLESTFNFISLILNKETKIINLDWKDEIIKSVILTFDGKTILDNFN